MPRSSHLTTPFLGSLWASILCIAALGLGGCASTSSIPIEEIMAGNPAISGLGKHLQRAEAADAEVLAPTGYATASGKLDEAIAAAREGNVQRANSLAAAGSEALDKLDADVATTRDVLREVLEVRERADSAGAEQIMPEEAKELEAKLRDTAALIENGKLGAAKERRQALIDGYSDLELACLKKGTAEAARAAISHAKDKGANKLAPKTFKLAQEEMALAKSILDANRTDTERAELHSKRAMSLAQQSVWIAELIKDFDRRDYSREDSVLWYQSQLAEIYEPVGAELEFDEPNREVVLGMQETYATLIKQRDETAASSEMKQEVLAQKLTSTEMELRARDEVEAKRRARFEEVQSLFLPAEATVYRQRENVLITAHGFDFPSGESEIKSNNFALCNKVIQAIALFPDSKIEISGHTDSTGSAQINEKVSADRAANVAKFLDKVGGIPKWRLSSKGFGKERPVASNETAEGRAENRRVEILIRNK
jgi:OOP family OmpA-OmpF porin